MFRVLCRPQANPPEIQAFELPPENQAFPDPAPKPAPDPAPEPDPSPEPDPETDPAPDPDPDPETLDFQGLTQALEFQGGLLAAGC